MPKGPSVVLSPGISPCWFWSLTSLRYILQFPLCLQSTSKHWFQHSLMIQLWGQPDLGACPPLQLHQGIPGWPRVDLQLTSELALDFPSLSLPGRTSTSSFCIFLVEWGIGQTQVFENLHGQGFHSRLEENSWRRILLSCSLLCQLLLSKIVSYQFPPTWGQSPFSSCLT